MCIGKKKKQSRNVPFGLLRKQALLRRSLLRPHPSPSPPLDTSGASRSRENIKQPTSGVVLCTDSTRRLNADLTRVCVSKPMRKGIERSARSTGLGMISVLLLFFRISRVVVEAARAITWTIRLGEEEGRAKEYAERVIRPLRARVHCELFGSRTSTLREFGPFAIRGGGGASFSFCSRRAFAGEEDESLRPDSFSRRFDGS